MRTLALALVAAAALAPAGARPAEQKIGFVDFRRALAEVEEGKSAHASLKRDFDEKQKILDKEKVDLEKLQAEFEKQAAVMSEEARREKAMEIERRMREAQGKLMGFQKELAEREQEVTRGIGEKMEAITREIADAEGLTFVFEKGNSGLVVAPAASDLTNELIRKYNARHKGGGEAKKKADGASKKKADDKKAAPAK